MAGECSTIDSVVVLDNLPPLEETVIKVLVSADFSYFAVLGQDGILQIFCLKQGKEAPKAAVIAEVVDVKWQQTRASGSSSLAYLTKHDTLEVTEVNWTGFVELKPVFDGQNMQLLREGLVSTKMETCRKMTLLEYDGNLVTVAVGQWHIMTFNVLDASLASHMSIEHITANVQDMQLSLRFLFVLDNDSLYIIARDTGNIMGQISAMVDSEPIENVSIPRSLAVSADSDIVAIVNTDSSVLLIFVWASEVAEWHSELSEDLLSCGGSVHNSESQTADRATIASSGIPGSIREWDSRSSLGSLSGLPHSPLEDIWSDAKHHQATGGHTHHTSFFDEDQVIQLLGTNVTWWGHHVQQLSTLNKIPNPIDHFDNTCVAVRRKVHIPSPSLSLTLQTLQVTAEIMSVCYRDSGCPEARANVVDTVSGTILQSVSVPEPCIVSLGSRIEQAHLVIADSKASVLVCHTSQDKLVNRVMLHQSAGAAENLSQINRWQRLSLPPALLTLGLNNRQLDMVAFYLKSCCTIQTTNIEPSSAGVNAVTSIISSVILQTASDSTSQVFADQLVKVTLDFLMNFLVALESKPDDNCQSVADVLINILQLRQLLKNPASHRLHSLIAPCLLLDVKVDGQWAEWTTECVVRDAILQRLIPTAQCVLMEREQSSSSGGCVLSSIEELGMQLALSSLQQSEWELATSLIKSLGQDVELVLQSFCFNTYNCDLRSMLEAVLVKQSLLDEQDKADLELLRQIDCLWPGQSFEAALNQCTWQLPLTQLTSQRKCISFFRIPKFLALNIDQPPNKSASAMTSPYASVSLRWLKALDQETRQDILSDGLMFADGHLDVHSDVLCSPLDAWKCWMRYNLTSELCQCVHRVCGCDVNTGTPLQGSAIEMVNWTSNMALPYLRDVILNEFARCGVFSLADIQEITGVIQRLSQIGAIFSFPHQTTQLDTSLTRADFYNFFVSFCVRNNLIHVLLELLDCIPHEQIGILTDDKGSWLTAMLDFATWESFPHSIPHVLKACLVNLDFLCPGTSTTPSCSGLGAAPLASVATLLYDPRPLSQVVVNSVTANADAIGQVDKALLQSSLRPKYPQMELALCQETSDQPVFDVLVYDLLKANEPYDIGHLFNWRTNLALPFCSQPEMQRLHGHQVELDFLYYLSQARPCFAVAKVLAQELLLKNTFHSQRVNGAAALAAGFALQHFMTPGVSAACVAIVEMLGCDSTWLRITLEAANLVTNSNNGEVLQNFCKDNPLLDFERLLVGVAKQQVQACNTFLQLLEGAVESLICQWEGFSRISMEHLVLLGLVTGFCRAHCLPLSCSFLDKYAKESNWLMMLLSAQCHLYPKEDVKNLVDHVPNCAIREHLQNVMVHIHVKHKAVVTSTHAVRPRDTRRTLYQKIGLSRERNRVTSADDQQFSDPDDGMQSSSDETADSLSGSAELGDCGPHIQKELLAATLETVHMLDACQPLLNHALLTNNSSFVLLADSCLGMSTDCARRLGLLCVWFVTSADEAFLPQISAVSSALHNRVWVLDDLATILIKAVEARRFTFLIQGLTLFVPESPLVPLTWFLASVVTAEKKKSIQDWLQNYVKALEVVQDTAVGLNREQLDQICTRLLCHTAGCCPSLRHAYHFLSTLQRNEVKRHFCSGILFPDLAQPLRLLNCLLTTGIGVNAKAFLWGKQDPAFEPECRRTLTLLIEGFYFNEARAFSQAADLGQETVLIAQLQEDLSRRQSLVQWQDPTVRHAFWTHCLDCLSGDSKTRMAASFLVKASPSAASHSEKFFLLQLALQAQSTDRKEAMKSFSSLEAEMWNSRFEAEMNIEFVGAEGQTFLDTRTQDGVSPHDLLCQGQCVTFPEEMVSGHAVETEKEQQAVSRIIGQQLDHGCLGSALRLAVYFDYRPRDVVLVQTCLNLAEGRISVEQADATMRSLNHKGIGDYPRRRLSRLSVRRPSFAGSEHEDLEEQLESKETLETLERLRDSCSHGSAICNVVVTYFRIACVLDLNFSYILEHPNVILVLKMILKSSAGDKFVLARELSTAHAIPDIQVAEFVAEEALSALHAAIDSSESHQQELMFNLTSESVVYFSSLVSLCREPLLVGNHLLDVAKNTHADAFHVQVELCILAHHCFSLACSTEGITRVLGRAKLLAATLAEVEEYVLMVRLLTGVGRYSELTCILDLLLENHQFELLLKKGMEKISDLKMALLDYLWRCHPHDTDMFTMVALHFLLYREIGEMHEHEAQTKLQSLATKSLDNSRAVCEQLENILQFWADAAESYSKADCPRLAQRCCRQASLVALQLHLLPSGRRILNLEATEVHNFIIGHSNFLEACLVAEVYSEHRVWPQAFYQQVVVRGNLTYLHDFHSHIGVSPSLIQDIVRRFKKEENASEKMPENLKRVIRLTKNVSDLHQLATELNFQDVAAQVLDGDGGAFVRDTFGT